MRDSHSSSMDNNEGVTGMKRIRTKNGVQRRYNAIINRLYREHPGGIYGWDMPTLSICHHNIYVKLNILKRLYRMLPERARRTV